MSITPGTKLGPYEIRSQIGAGGKCEVYLGEGHEARSKQEVHAGAKERGED